MNDTAIGLVTAVLLLGLVLIITGENTRVRSVHALCIEALDQAYRRGWRP